MNKLKTASLLALIAIVVILVSTVFTPAHNTTQPSNTAPARTDKKPSADHNGPVVAGASSVVSVTSKPTIPMVAPQSSNGSAIVKSPPTLPAPTVPSPTPTPSPVEQVPKDPRMLIEGPFDASIEPDEPAALSLKVKGGMAYEWKPGANAQWMHGAPVTPASAVVATMRATAVPYIANYLDFTLYAPPGTEPGVYQVSFVVVVDGQEAEVPVAVSVVHMEPPAAH